MSETIRVLVVEDQAVEQGVWENLIELHNADHGALQFVIEFAVSLNQAEAHLRDRRYDAAIVDIRLYQDGAAGANVDGNAVIKRICQSGLMVVAAFTGEGGLVESKTVKVFTKGNAEEGDGTEAVLTWLIEQASLIKAVRSADELVQKQLAHLFHGSVWPRWKRWAEKSADAEIVLPLARHLTSHVHAALLEKQGQRVHPEEWYFIPPIRAGIRTGDVVKFGETDFQIVVSPRCDLSENSKVGHILLAKCTYAGTEWSILDAKVRDSQQALLDATPGGLEGAQKALDKAQRQLREFTQHKGNTNAVHFLPGAWLQDESKFGPVFVNFDQLTSVAKGSDEANALLVGRVAAVSPEFLPSLVERLGSYLSRIGTPDYSHPAL